MNNRKSGILLHISSLPGPHGIGDLGRCSYNFADFLKCAGQTYWQVLPLTPTLNVHGNSPYSSYSAFAGNPLFISADILMDEGLLSKDDLPAAMDYDSNRVNFKHVYQCKNHIIEKAYKVFDKSGKKSGEFEKFISYNDYWIHDYALFVCIKNHIGGKPWNEFPPGLKSRQKDEITSAQKQLSDNIKKEIFIQFIFLKQWQRLKNYCSELGIKIIGDLPIYLNYDSSDVWSHPEYFKLDDNTNPTVVAGVPPDYFSKTGQLWGNPVYDWEYLTSRDYDFFMHRIVHNLELFDVLRLDHFRGFVHYWEVPAGEKNAVNGMWVQAPADEFFTHLTKKFSSDRFIAEDLGTITQDVIDIKDQFNFAGMKILQFAFGDDYPHGSYLPHNHVRNCVVYTGTHDNNTTLGWWKGECSDEQKKRVRDYLNSDINDKNINQHMIDMAMGSVADTVIIPMQDFLGLGKQARMNTPSTVKNNWQWKILNYHSYDNIAEKIRESIEKFGRI